MLFPIVSFLPAVLLFLFSVFLWLSAKNLESPSQPIADPSAGALGITPEILQSIAFSFAGILILVGTLSYLPNLIVQLTVKFQGGIPENWLRFWLDLAIAVIRLALGFWLLFGAKGIRALTARFLNSIKPLVQKDW